MNAPTTKISFFHWRTTRGLATHVKRIAKWIRRQNFTERIPEFENKLKEAESSGSIKFVKDDFNMIADLFKQEAKGVFTILKEELIILNEEAGIDKKDTKLESELRAFNEMLIKTGLKQEYDEKIGIPHAKFHNYLKETNGKIRTMLGNLKAGSDTFVTMNNTGAAARSELGLENTMIGIARKERDEIMINENAINKAFKHLDKAASFARRKNEIKFKKEITELFNIEQDLFKHLEDEMKMIFEVLSRAAILYAGLVSHLKKNLVGNLEKLKELKFPIKSWEKLSKKASNLFKDINNQMGKIYKLSRYEDWTN